MAALRSFFVLDIGRDVEELAALYAREIHIPKGAMADALHLAVATWHRMDYLVSWNCSHIVSGRVRAMLVWLNEERTIGTPTICTPEELMEV